MSKDSDLDIMNIIKDMDDEDSAFYFRADVEDGFFYYKGTIESIGADLFALMEQDANVKAIVVEAVKNLQE